MKGSGSGRRSVASERGATLVEFAVVAPLLFLLLFGVIEFARVVSAYTTVWTGAREGARYATTTEESEVTSGVPRFRDCAGILQAVQAKAVTTSIDVSDVTIQWIDPTGTPIADCEAGGLPDPKEKTSGVWAVDIPRGTTVTVHVQAEFDAVVPLLESFLDGLDLDSRQTRSIYEGIIGGT
jgi:Flp pilus assembly pilin Flp